MFVEVVVGVWVSESDMRGGRDDFLVSLGFHNLEGAFMFHCGYGLFWLQMILKIGLAGYFRGSRI